LSGQEKTNIDYQLDLLHAKLALIESNYKTETDPMRQRELKGVMIGLTLSIEVAELAKEHKQ
jgi:hypothetical protein